MDLECLEGYYCIGIRQGGGVLLIGIRSGWRVIIALEVDRVEGYHCFVIRHGEGVLLLWN